MFNTIKTAVVGTGFMGPVHVEALRRLGIEVTGILGSRREKSEKAAQALLLPKGYSSFQEILDDKAVTSVHITTPNVLHFEMAKSALEAGKHVLCEKPLAMTTEESSELVKIAEKSGFQAGVNYNQRFYPLNLEARSLVEKGELGEIHSISGGYVQDWLLYETDYNWRVLAERGGALRAIADIGTHWIDLITTITGLKVAEVFADLVTVHKTRKRPKGEVQTFSGKQQNFNDMESIPITTDDMGTIIFRFTNNARASIWISQMTAGRKNCLRYEIAGSKKALYWESESPNALWVGCRDKANEMLIRDPALVSPSAGEYITFPGGHNEGFGDTFKQCFRAFYNKVAGIASDVMYPTFEEGHKEIVLCEAILESNKKRAWVSID